ncbi:MAG: hypothetical protein ACYCXQ_05445 [Candidatus Humimicrobiaceae bacterium]
MIKNTETLEKFEKKYIKKNNLTFEEKSRVYESLWAEALLMKVLPSKDPLEGIENDIKIAWILNSLHKK